MAIVRGDNAVNSFQISKKLSLPNQYGNIIFGVSKYGHLNKYAGIYQQRHGVKGRINVKEKFYWPTNPQTEPQQLNREKYADSVLAWQNLTDNEKAVYNNRAKRFRYSGYNLFQKEYMLSH